MTDASQMRMPKPDERQRTFLSLLSRSLLSEYQLSLNWWRLSPTQGKQPSLILTKTKSVILFNTKSASNKENQYLYSTLSLPGSFSVITDLRNNKLISERLPGQPQLGKTHSAFFDVNRGTVAGWKCWLFIRDEQPSIVHHKAHNPTSSFQKNPCVAANGLDFTVKRTPCRHRPAETDANRWKSSPLPRPLLPIRLCQ